MHAHLTHSKSRASVKHIHGLPFGTLSVCLHDVRVGAEGVGAVAVAAGAGQALVHVLRAGAAPEAARAGAGEGARL